MVTFNFITDTVGKFERVWSTKCLDFIDSLEILLLLDYRFVKNFREKYRASSSKMWLYSCKSCFVTLYRNYIVV